MIKSDNASADNGQVSDRSVKESVSAELKVSRFQSENLKRFVADYALDHDIKPVGAEEKNGHKVAVISLVVGSLTYAGDLAAWI